MSVRKRTWRNADGSQGEAWVTAYTDHEGKRRIRSFEKDARPTPITSASAPICAPAPTSRQPERHGRGGRAVVARRLRGGRAGALDARLLPAALGAAHHPAGRGGEALAPHGADGARLRGQARHRSLPDHGAQGPRLARRAADRCAGTRVGRAERGAGVARRRRRGKDARAAARQNGKLKVGVDIPSPDEIRAIVAAASDGRQPLLLSGFSPACASPSCAACAGMTLISNAPSCMCASAPTATTPSASRSRSRASASSRCRRCWSACCGSGSSPVRIAS